MPGQKSREELLQELRDNGWKEEFIDSLDIFSTQGIEKIIDAPKSCVFFG